jgi:hypothetical protein
MDIWEIEPHFKCPVVGAMLSVEKHRAILKKCGYDVLHLKPYEYHQKIMMKLSDKNSVSVKVNNFIKNNSRKCMIQVSQAGPGGMRQLWDEHKKSGNVGPMMFAVVSCRDSDVELLCDVYGEVHMLAHANMTKVFDIQKQLAKNNEALAREQQKVGSKTDRIKELVKSRKTDTGRILALEAENRNLECRIREFENRVGVGNSFNGVVSGLEGKVAALEQQLCELNEKFDLVEKEKRRFQIQAFNFQNENQTLRAEFESLVDNFGAFAADEPDQAGLPCEEKGCLKDECERYRLCAKRIFMVGGITKMKAYYKNIIEKAGGEFDYHDGYIKNTASNLEARVKRSDLVLCPVNCNSHTACLKVKQLCMRHNIELKILSSSSLSAVSNALFIPDNQNQMILN